MVRNLTFGVVLYFCLALAGLTVVGCAAADRFFNPGQDGKSQAQRVGESLTGLPPPWNEIIPGVILFAQNTYLGVAKYRNGRKSKKKGAESTTPSEAKSPA